MEKTCSPSTSSRPPLRSFVSVTFLALSATALTAGGCSNAGSDLKEASSNDNVSASGGSKGSMGSGGATDFAPGAGGFVSGAGGSNVPGAGGSTESGAGGGVVSGAGGGAVSGAGGSESPAEPCVDLEPPYDPEWPDATCEGWASETDACGEDWFADYCDASCGRCVPEGTPEAPPCEDIEPPYDPEWPDATCEGWASETDACGEDWFSNYCDISCERCVPEGGLPEPEEEPCEDIEPPYDPEWPDATCSNWALESDACGEDWFSDYCDISCGRCVPEGGLPEQPMAPDCSGEGLPNVTGGQGHATRYWDCCQTHCGQFTGHKCSQDGVSQTGDGTSSCNGGGSFACYDEAPRAVSECLSYGHIAKASPNCGECYRIQFTGEGEYNENDPGSRLIAGKQMIVKVTNTGSDVGSNQFDLMIPGGGVGQFNACSRQWGTNDLGAQYGGFLTDCTGSHAEKKECVRQECMKIPAGDARDGCLWFVDWLQVADNPKFTSEPTNCPF